MSTMGAIDRDGDGDNSARTNLVQFPPQPLFAFFVDSPDNNRFELAFAKSDPDIISFILNPGSISCSIADRGSSPTHAFIFTRARTATLLNNRRRSAIPRCVIDGIDERFVDLVNEKLLGIWIKGLPVCPSFANRLFCSWCVVGFNSNDSRRRVVALREERSTHNFRIKYKSNQLAVLQFLRV
jgi:hypothetical protein